MNFFNKKPPTLDDRRRKRIELSEIALFEIRLEKEACVSIEAKLLVRIERLRLELNQR